MFESFVCHGIFSSDVVAKLQGDSPATRSLVVLARLVGHVGSNRLFTNNDLLFKMNSVIEPLQPLVNEIIQRLAVRRHLRVARAQGSLTKL